MTEIQVKVLTYIKVAPQPPTMREIADAIGISRARAHQVVKQLADLAEIDVIKYAPRGIRA